jgi:hypothetical protein
MFGSLAESNQRPDDWSNEDQDSDILYNRLGLEVRLEESDDQFVCNIGLVDKEQNVAPKTLKAYSY